MIMTKEHKEAYDEAKIKMDSCENCKYREEHNGKLICSFEVHNNNGEPEELPPSFWCENFKEINIKKMDLK